MVYFYNVLTEVQIELTRTARVSIAVAAAISLYHYSNGVIVRFQSMNRHSSVTFSPGYETGEDDVRWRGKFCGVTFFSLKVVREST